MVRLDEFDKEEWWDIMRLAVRNCGGRITREEFEDMWDDFCAMKRAVQERTPVAGVLQIGG